MKKLLYILTFLFVACFVQATNYYVDKATGNNADNGTTEALAWETITYAASAASGIGPGDNIYVKAGTSYGNEKVVMEVSGTAENRISFIGYKTTPGDAKDDWVYPDDAQDAAEMPYLEYGTVTGGPAFHFSDEEYITIKNFQTLYYKLGVHVIGGYNIVENFYIKNPGGITGVTDHTGIHLDGNKRLLDGEYINDSDSSKVVNCIVVNPTGMGIEVRSDYDTILNCRVYCDNDDGVDNDGTDYYIVVVGRFNHVDSCYTYRDPSIEHAGHGIGIKGTWIDSTQYNTISNSTSVNMDENFWVAHRGATYNTFTNNTVIGGVTAYHFRDGASNNTFNGGVAHGSRSLISGNDGPEDGGAQYAGRYNEFLNLVADSCTYGFEFRRPNSYYLDTELDSCYVYNCNFYECDTLFLTMLENHGNLMINCNITGTPVLESVGSEWANNFTITHSDFYDGFSKPAGTGNIEVDPLFTDAPNDDWTLGTGSPCIDAGTDVGLDYYGAAPDMGAFETEEAEPPVTHPRSLSTNGRGSFRKSGGRFIKQ